MSHDRSIKRITPFNFSSSPLVVVPGPGGDEDVADALVRLSPELDEASRASFDRDAAVAELVTRGARRVRWSPRVTRSRVTAEAAAPTDGQVTVMDSVRSWLAESGLPPDLVRSVEDEVAALLEWAGVPGSGTR